MDLRSNSAVAGCAGFVVSVGIFVGWPSRDRWAPHLGELPTDCLQGHQRKKVHYYFHSNEPLSILVPER